MLLFPIAWVIKCAICAEARGRNIPDGSETSTKTLRQSMLGQPKEASAARAE